MLIVKRRLREMTKAEISRLELYFRWYAVNRVVGIRVALEFVMKLNPNLVS